MIDQAAQLRRLVAGALSPHGADGTPRTLVVAGGKPGVGATTLAVNLAAALASDALRVVLIDADLYRADVAAQCGLAGGHGIGDVLAGRKTIHEALQRGPCGLHVLAGTASAETRAGVSDRSLLRLSRQMRSLAPHADWLVVDVGNQPSEIASRIGSAADRVLLVTTPDAVAVMDTYALLKTLFSRQQPKWPQALVVNQVDRGASASDVHRRIDQSCRRFLGLSIELAGELPLDPQAAATGRRGVPLVLGAPRSKLAEAVGRLARQTLDLRRNAPAPQRRAA